MPKPNGAILYSGPSLLDGAPIVVIAIGLASGSTNRKTGSMLQTYILRSDMEPTLAVKSGADAAICGNCRHRGAPGEPVGRTCYVNVGQGPLGVYRAFKRGVYPTAIDLVAIGNGRMVRLGTYGDPAAVPVGVWTLLTKSAQGRTGYTHQWRTAHGLRALCMASVDTMHEAEEARASGWRYFRVAMPTDLARLPMESICPASKEAGYKLKCETCLACSGAVNGRKGSIVIQAHGGFAVMANVKRLSKAIGGTNHG
jgi:hypothetical protein